MHTANESVNLQHPREEHHHKNKNRTTKSKECNDCLLN